MSTTWIPKVMCNACGFHYDEEPGIFDFAQNLGDTCRQFGYFRNMIPFNTEEADKLIKASECPPVSEEELEAFIKRFGPNPTLMDFFRVMEKEGKIKPS